MEMSVSAAMVNRPKILKKTVRSLRSVDPRSRFEVGTSVRNDPLTSLCPKWLCQKHQKINLLSVIAHYQNDWVQTE